MSSFMLFKISNDFAVTDDSQRWTNAKRRFEHDLTHSIHLNRNLGHNPATPCMLPYYSFLSINRSSTEEALTETC